MPELPEVEVTRRGFADAIAGARIRALTLGKPLRWPLGVEPSVLVDQRVLQVRRRGKYLLVDLSTGMLLIHLGMSGSLRIVAHNAPLQKHDHIDWVLDECVLRYHDPRRFGSVQWHGLDDGDYLTHPRLIALGIEPFDEAFTGEYLYQKSRGKKAAIKVALLAGEMVVGVGNIYASEVLFRCKIHPEKTTESLTRAQCELLAQNIKIVLQEAINKGGSTLKDFVNSDGLSGYFQMHYNVYDRSGLPCTMCGKTIQRIVQAQRATYFCAHCQKASKIRAKT